MVERRTLLQAAVAAGVLPYLSAFGATGATGSDPILRAIPSSGERLPVIGMGTMHTFDVEGDEPTFVRLAEVLQAFFDNGGALVDSSPMYGKAEQVFGDVLQRTTRKDALFTATKVWADGKQQGIDEMYRSMGRMRVTSIDLMQIHNLRDWRTHIETLREWKEQGKIRYIGVTTSHGRRHDELVEAMQETDFDFVQFTYNIVDREAENRLLPMARDRGAATLINLPFGRATLFDKVRGKQLPEWASEFDCASWAQFFLKFCLGDPAVTCVIPATSKPHHMVDNMGAGFGRLPDADMRQRMIRHLESL
ncbi:MAG: aldo/keto reductase [Gammaproteobacteria bacterium]|nr:aldo/keto reductase [Gammaproteobacteria bacterium]MDH4255420.1 aldo/keto reductase [Gammaproteobacteria bacterium]MDH5310204.1 aldo/keto reductase [Gammaproteobacteria bacterium]